jgi:hypothetical protein
MQIRQCSSGHGNQFSNTCFIPTLDRIADYGLQDRPVIANSDPVIGDFEKIRHQNVCTVQGMKDFSLACQTSLAAWRHCRAQHRYPRQGCDKTLQAVPALFLWPDSLFDPDTPSFPPQWKNPCTNTLGNRLFHDIVELLCHFFILYVVFRGLHSCRPCQYQLSYVAAACRTCPGMLATARKDQDIHDASSI